MNVTEKYINITCKNITCAENFSSAGNAAAWNKDYRQKVCSEKSLHKLCGVLESGGVANQYWAEIMEPRNTRRFLKMERGVFLIDKELVSEVTKKLRMC